MTPLVGLLLALAPGHIRFHEPAPVAEDPPPSSPDVRLRMDAALPHRPTTELAPTAAPKTRDLGTPTTLYVNFDGIELDECSQSNAKLNCHWYNNDEAFDPFSGTLQTKVSILQAMRRDASDYGIRVTGLRPSADEDYTMVVYGGAEVDYGALGSAPAGDCGDQLPNQIVFAHVDGELNGWVNGGATTALHEAAHSWGLDHVDAEQSIMFPAGGNAQITFSHSCAPVVKNTDLEPGKAACPEVNALFCDNGDLQDAPAVLEHLFGPGYLDTESPTITLVEPSPGTYFQAPANFDVVFELDDDLHPQAYSMAAWVGEDGPPSDAQSLLEPGFSVSALPIGEWEFHVIVADEAGNASTVDFTIVVGQDPPPSPDEDGCGCRSGGPRGAQPAALALLLLGMGAGARRRKTR